MDYADLVKALMDARNKAQITGRPLSADEARGISSGYFDTAENRALQGRQLNLQSKALDYQMQHNNALLSTDQWKTLKMLEAAKKARRNEMYDNLLKSGVGLGGLAYLNYK